MVAGAFAQCFHTELAAVRAVGQDDGAIVIRVPDREACEGATRHLAEKLGSNNKTAATFLEHLADTAIKETKKNGLFVLPGLGRLKKVHRKARMGRNPQTGEPIQIKAKTTAKFYLAKAAKDAIAPKK